LREGPRGEETFIPGVGKKNPLTQNGWMLIQETVNCLKTQTVHARPVTIRIG